MAFPRSLKELCKPALLYFIISILATVVLLVQNLGNNGIYHVGCFSCKVPSTTVIFIVKLVYILFWTWILNLMCKDGHSEISWLLVLLPLILLFVMMGMLLLNF